MWILSKWQINKNTQRAKTHAKEIETLLHDIEWAETSAANEVVKRKAPEEMTARELTTQALAVQEESTAATDRIKKNLLETEQVSSEFLARVGC